jgi:homoserine kinase
MSRTADTAHRRTRRTITTGEARARLSDYVISVPASAANLGPGFDTIAVALQLYLRVRTVVLGDDAPNRLSFDFSGGTLTGDNYIERAFRALAEDEGVDVPSLSIEVSSDIPMRGGLGSSGAATVAGLRLFERLAGTDEGRDMLSIATRLDRHADNVSAALLGGLTLSCVGEDGRVIARAVRWPERLKLVVATPSIQVATPDARRVLPEQYSRADAVFNLQRALLLVHAIEHGELEALREALRDRWHQPYRACLVPGLREALAMEHPQLHGVCLSGSGPAVLAFATGAFDEIERRMSDIYAGLRIPCVVRTIAAHQPGAMA